MRKVNGKSAIFLFFLTLLIVVGLFIKTSVNTNNLVDANDSVNDHNSINARTPVKELKISGLTIQLEEEITESEIKNILKNYNLDKYRLDYDVKDIADKYYIKVDEDKRNELKKEENWNDPIYPEIPEPRFPEIKKGNYYYILISEEGLEDESFLKVMEKYNLRVKKFVWCELYFENGSMNWIPETDAIKIKNEIKKNEKILNVFPNYIDG